MRRYPSLREESLAIDLRMDELRSNIRKCKDEITASEEELNELRNRFKNITDDLRLKNLEGKCQVAKSFINRGEYGYLYEHILEIISIDDVYNDIRFVHYKAETFFAHEKLDWYTNNIDWDYTAPSIVVNKIPVIMTNAFAEVPKDTYDLWKATANSWLEESQKAK